MENQLLKKSSTIAAIATFALFGAWFGFSKLSLGIDTSNWTPYAMKKNSVVSEQLIIMCGTSGSGIVFGTTSGAWVGTPTDSTLARVFFNTATGQLEFKPSGSATSFPFGSVTVAYLDANYATIGSVSAKLDAVGGVGTSNILNNTTLAGVGTLAATLNANGANISPTEVSFLDGMSENINNKLATVSGSVTNHAHNGSDGTTKISHADLIPASKGTQTHTQLDDFVASKGQALGLGTLDAYSLVVQNPASASKTPGTSTIVMTGTNTDRIADAFLSDNITKMGTPTTNNISEGSTNKYYTDARVNAVIGSSSVGSRLNEQIISVADGHHFVYDAALGKWKNATSTAAIGFDGITGVPSDNTHLAKFLGVDTLLVPGTTTAITGTSASGRLYNLKSVENSLVSGTKYLLHFNGGSGTSNFEDSSTFARTIVAVGSATHSPTQIKFGSTSCYLDSTGDSVTTTSSVTDFSPGTQTFSADIWAFYNGTKGSVTATLFGKRSGAGSWANDGHEYFLSVEDDNKLQFYYNSSNNPVAITGTNTLAFTAGWHHYKVVNASSGFFMYFDGVLAQSAAKINITATTGGTPKFVIGERNSDQYWPGYVDEMNFVIGTDGETSGFILRAIEYGVSYDKYTLSYIPIGTTTPSIKQEYGTPTNTTVTYLQGDLIVDKPARYSTATAYCAEFSLSKPIIVQAVNLYPCDSIHKEIIEPGSITPQQEAFNTILNTGIYKFLWKTPELEKAKPMIAELTKVDYGRKDYKQEQILWEEVYRVNYVTIVGGSQTVNSKQMAADFEAYYLNNQYFEFDNMSAQEKNVLIYEKKKTIANADKRNESNNIGIVLDRNCPDEMKLNGLPEISKMVQLEISAQKEAAERIVKMEKEIKSLTAALENLRVINNLK